MLSLLPTQSPVHPGPPPCRGMQRPDAAPSTPSSHQRGAAPPSSSPLVAAAASASASGALVDEQTLALRRLQTELASVREQYARRLQVGRGGGGGEGQGSQVWGGLPALGVWCVATAHSNKLARREGTKLLASACMRMPAQAFAQFMHGAHMPARQPRALPPAGRA